MDRPGVVRVFCDIHSHMNAFVLVFNHPFFDVTDADGRFQLPVAALRHLHARRLVRGRGTRHAIGGRPAGRLGRSGSGRPVMRVLGSITNRIFLASALLAMLSIGAAVYFVSSRMTSETEAELQGDLTEAATLVEEQRVTQFDNVARTARLIADLPKFKAVVEIGDRPTLMPIAADYQEQAGADLLIVTGRRGEQLALVGETAAAHPVVRRLDHRRGQGTADVLGAPARRARSRQRSGHARARASGDSRHADARLPARRSPRRAVQVAHRRRHRVRDGRLGSRLDAWTRIGRDAEAAARRHGLDADHHRQRGIRRPRAAARPESRTERTGRDHHAIAQRAHAHRSARSRRRWPASPSAPRCSPSSSATASRGPSRARSRPSPITCGTSRRPAT